MPLAVVEIKWQRACIVKEVNRYVRIRENSLLARLAAKKLRATQVAIVFGNEIHLHNTSRQEFLSAKTWVKHELKHVEQYQHHGFLPFLFRYLVEYVRVGYWNNYFEVEARAAEDLPGDLDQWNFI